MGLIVRLCPSSVQHLSTEWPSFTVRQLLHRANLVKITSRGAPSTLHAVAGVLFLNEYQIRGTSFGHIQKFSPEASPRRLPPAKIPYQLQEILRNPSLDELHQLQQGSTHNQELLRRTDHSERKFVSTLSP